MEEFDGVWFVCPTCGTKLVLQSKAGSRTMRSYHINVAPVVIAADVANRGPYRCEKCGAAWKVDLLWITSLMRVVSDSAAPAMETTPLRPSQPLVQASAETELQQPVNERLMTESEVADFLRVTPKIIERWRSEGAGPRYYRVEKNLVRYSMDQVLEWLKWQRKG